MPHEKSVADCTGGAWQAAAVVAILPPCYFPILAQFGISRHGDGTLRVHCVPRNRQRLIALAGPMCNGAQS